MKKLKELVKNYPYKQAALLPVIWQVQEQEGFISAQKISEIAELLEMSAAEVLGVVSFYTMFQRRPIGRYHVQVCTNLCCRLKGADWLLKYLKQKLGVEVGQTSGDGLFHLSTVECLGSCGTAPMMMINNDYYEDLDEKKVDEILLKLG
ncbi:MAG: NADH-quinone oxidoreductase subunit NuoE [Pseudomonadota bacterium]